MNSTMFQTVDFTAAACTITHARSQVVDFTYPFYFETNTVMINKPKESMVSKLLLFAKPYRTEVRSNLSDDFC